MIEKEKDLYLLERATVAEKSYNWIEAARLYERVLDLYLKSNFTEKVARTYKKLGYANTRAAESADTSKEFIKRSQFAIEAYENAVNFFKQIGNKSEELECNAEALYYNSYIAGSLKEEIDSYSNSYELFIESSELFSKEGNQEGFSRNLSRAVLALGFLTFFTSDNKESKKLIQKCEDLDLKSSDISKKLLNFKSIFESFQGLYFTNFTRSVTTDFRWDKQFKESNREALLSNNEFLRIIKNNYDFKFLGGIYSMTGSSNGFYGVQFTEDEGHQRELIDKGLKLLEKGLDFAKRANNKPIILFSLFWLDWWAWLGGKVEYLQKRILKDLDELVKLGEIFRGSFNIFSWEANFLPALYYANFAQRSFFTPEQRKIYAEKSIKHCIEALKISSMTPYSTLSYQSLTWSYSQLVILATVREEQDDYAQKMLHYAKLAKKFSEKYDGGIGRAGGYSSLSKAYKTLADIAENNEKRINMLTKAIKYSKYHIKHAMEGRTGALTVQVRVGLLYEELGIITKETEPLIMAKETFFNIVMECVDRGYFSYEAACHEYIARLEDRLSNHLASAEHYLKAANSHVKSLKTIKYKPLINRINEKIDYVKAWNLIEVAKSYHKRENHIKAMEYYGRAYEILNHIPNYDYEALYCSAWILQEEAEQFSKQDKHEKSIESFEKTKKLFKNVIKKLENSSIRVQDKIEKERIIKLEKVAKIRIKHCSARINLEEARILGKTGEHIAAAEKFATAATQIREFCTIFKIQREQEELEAVYYLCKAWESMELAETYEDPEKFEEAASLFTKASHFFTNTKMKLLSRGNSSFCQALEHGIKFDKTPETKIKAQLYPKIKTMLRTASSSYRKGGYEIEADWALATGTYFDAMWYLIRVDEELELDKRNDLLEIGSQYLKSAAELFGKSNYKNKEREVLEYLEMIEKEKKILISALSTIKEPSISRSTTGILAPTCPVETSLSPRLSEIRNITEQSRMALADRTSMKKSKSEYKDTVREQIDLEKIESEVNVEKQKFICVVHKGPIRGTIYLCPTCETLYCSRCAQALNDKDEKCWSCNQDIKL